MNLSFFSLPLFFFWLPATLIHSQVNTAQQSVSIKLYCNSQFSICHRVHLQQKHYDFREQYNAICFGLLQNSENYPAAKPWVEIFHFILFFKSNLFNLLTSMQWFDAS